MQTQRLVSTAATILGLTITAARADIYMELGINKRHFQTSSNAVRFDHGELNLYVRDGIVLLAPCSSDPELFFYGPHLGCALGITGYVAWGDFNRDGVSDANQYWSIDRVIPAIAIAPSFPQLCSLVSAPPSKLPRPLRIFRDGAVTVFHDLRTPQVTQYNLALYEMVRRYGSVRQVETLVTAGNIGAEGTIIATVTGVDFPGGVTVPVTIELDDQDGVPVPRFAEEWAENVRLALQANAQISAVYTVSGTANAVVLTEIVPNGNDPTLKLEITAGTTTSPGLPLASLNTVAGTFVASQAAALKQMNEELVTGRYVFAFPSKQSPTTTPVNLPVTIVQNVEAFGSNPRTKGGFRFTSGKFDQGFYQMDPRTISTVTWTGNDATNIVPGDQLYFSILNPSQDRLTFPPTVPQAPVLLSTPAVQSYTLPPNFFQVGDEGVIELRHQRTLPVTPITYDRSRREFRMPVKFIDTYGGYGQRAFPLGTAGDTTPSGDFDRDGMPNIQEYAYQFPTNAEISAAAKAQFVPATNPLFVTVEEFSRVIEQEPEPISDPIEKPDGPIAPELDDTNHLVFKVPYRSHTGTSLRYDFVEMTTNNRGKVKTKKIKPGAKWQIGFEEGETITRIVHVEVKQLDPATREVTDIGIRATPMNVDVTQQFIVLRSVDPVANPAAPLPNIGVQIVPVDIR
jgi:hypothetical protein